MTVPLSRVQYRSNAMGLEFYLTLSVKHPIGNYLVIRCSLELEGNSVQIGDRPAAVIGDEIRIRPLF